MTHLLTIFHDKTLYEIRFEGTFIRSIRKFHQGGMTEFLKFANLPDKVKITVLKEISKRRGDNNNG